MLDNTARQLDPEPMIQPEQPQPAITPQAIPAAAPKAVPFTVFERGLAFMAGALIVVMSLWCLFTRTNLATTQRAYEDMQSQIADQTTKVNNYKQAIGELSTSERLSAFAKDHGLSTTNGTIKRVTK
ncbi:cell division protein FtsL [Lacticaseibacillus brantae]|nr:cell division protein FtsL [Lacticaseibacillus brantae]